MGQQISKWEVDVDGAALSGELHRVLGVSHRQAKGLIDARCVTINSEVAKTHGSRLKIGDVVSVNFDADTTYHELPRPSRKNSDATVNILWEDEHLVFVDKPAGLLSVPTEHSDDNSLADVLVEYYRQRGIKKPRIYIVHRLDRYTTGVIIFAKTPEALDGLRDLFHDHDIHRVYIAILVGELPENNGTLHDKLAERKHRLKMAVIAKRAGDPKPKGTKPAITHYRVIERLPGHTVVELKLETGRRNQIRVQFAERGYPVLGDKIYGSTHPTLDRQALHAKLLGLRHPVTDETVTVISDIPTDMADALQKLRVARRIDRAKAGIKGEEGIFKPRITRERKQGRALRAKRFTEGANWDGDDGPPKPRARRDDGEAGNYSGEGRSAAAPRTSRYPKRSEDGPSRPARTRFNDGPPKPRARRDDGEIGDTRPKTRNSRPTGERPPQKFNRASSDKPKPGAKTNSGLKRPARAPKQKT
jgi:23S rRNA pseudouridine1911/1915/1917 synthase